MVIIIVAIGDIDYNSNEHDFKNDKGETVKINPLEDCELIGYTDSHENYTGESFNEHSHKIYDCRRVMKLGE